MNRRWTLTFALIVAIAAFCTQSFAQSLISGDIAGSVTDPSGAVMPNVSINLKSLDTGATQTAATNQSGAYRFSLLKPGRYTVLAAQTGFQNAQRAVEVSVGQIVTADLQLAVGSNTQTVEVSAAAPLVSTESSMNTAFTATEVQQLPSAGGDITNIADTVPGVVVNNTGGYGNFTINGLPATSNLFTVNGENDMDPYFNINNSGATNLTIGQNEIEEATVIANPYSGQYGQLSGAQVTMITKSGTNQFHGNALYWWNGRDMNANNWFNNSSINGYTPRPFSNANQWAGSIGGPIIKDKTFFFVDTEGLRFVLPNVDSVTIPTPEFATAVANNVALKQPSEAATYTKLLNLWASAPGAGNAVPLANSCSGLTSLPGFDPTTQNCAARYQATPTALASEFILAFKVDQKIGNHDNAYFRYKLDHGTQPTTLDPINSNFNALSNQPSYDMQLNETHVFGPTSTNEFMATFSHYVAQFAQNHDLASGTFPYQIATSGSVPFTGFNLLGSFPQGRNITQYQFIDNFTHIAGKHNLKFGINFRRYDVSDHNFFFNSPAVYFGYTGAGLQRFADGVAYQYRMNKNLASDVPVALWGTGIYAQDEWAISSNLKLTLALRAEHNSNPVCQFNCFANFKTSFSGLSSVNSASPGDVPYSSDISYGQHSAYQGTDSVNWSPRIGFAWSPGHSTKTVINGGIGIFYDNPAAGLVDDLLANPPVSVAIRVRPKSGVLPFDPGPTGGASIWGNSANSFDISKSYNQIKSELTALGSIFAAPSVTAISGTIHSPQWQEWSLQLQRQITGSTVLIVGYAGNHGIRIPYTNQFLNEFDAYGLYGGVSSIPQSAAVPNYGTVTQVQSGAISNYNGVTFTFRKQFSKQFSMGANYTYSHNLDEVSNGGLFTYGDSLLGQLNPTSLRANNYGNSDYDIRHLFNAYWVYDPAFHFESRFMKGVFNGWEFSGKWFWRSGLPLSITDNNTALGNYAGTILGTPNGQGSGQATSCGEAAALTPCLNASAFVDGASATFNGYTTLSSQTRNQYRGPHYFNVDMNLYKTFHFGERARLGIGAQAFNVFNHPNFGLPDSGLGDATFGQITSMANAPTSPYGVFLGFDSSVRVLQLSGKLQF
jgi:Carboxypeptidase regulatory-like domain/TonB-dependent Receptor Plug Domain